METLLLVADIGNTHTAVGLFKGEEIVCKWRFSTRNGLTADEVASMLLPLLQAEGAQIKEVRHLAIASVVPPADRAWEGFAIKYIGKEPLKAGSTLPVPLKVRYKRPHELGADRLVNAYGAMRLRQGPLVVVDYGTATTFDCISLTGEYLGGVIAPGLLLGAEALASGTAKLPMIDVTLAPGPAVAQDTETAIRNGLLWGHAGMTKEILHRIRMEMGGECGVVATGGLAQVMMPLCPEIGEVIPDLTLLGLGWLALEQTALNH